MVAQESIGGKSEHRRQVRGVPLCLGLRTLFAGAFERSGCIVSYGCIYGLPHVRTCMSGSFDARDQTGLRRPYDGQWQWQWQWPLLTQLGVASFEKLQLSGHGCNVSSRLFWNNPRLYVKFAGWKFFGYGIQANANDID